MAPSGDGSVSKSHSSEGPCVYLPQSFSSRPVLGTTETAAERPEASLDEKLDRLKAEYEGAARAHGALYRGSTIPEEDRARAAEIEPDLPAVVRRLAELASTAPKSPAV